MTYVDPIKLLIEKASTESHAAKEIGNNIVSDLPYELPMTPSASVNVKRYTVASTYRTPIPVLFDPDSRTTYPMPNDK
jgi:hypothetical protein